MSAATAAPSGFCALRMRSTIRGERAASAGDKRSFDVIKETNRALSVSSSGCRLFQAMDGISLSCPQCASTSLRTGSASKFLIFARSDGDLELHVRRWIARQLGDLLANRRRHVAEISRRANAPGAVSGIGMREHLQMKRRLKRAAADQRPQRVQSCFALRGAENDLLQFRAVRSSSAQRRCDAAHSRQPLRQNPLRRFAEINVPAGQPRDQLVVALTRQIDLRRARRVLVAQPIEPPLEPVHALRIARGVLRAMIAIVPVEHVETPIRPDLQRHRHEPRIVRDRTDPARLSPGKSRRRVATGPR